jgi:hypothetical protein
MSPKANRYTTKRKVVRRVWTYCHARLAFTKAAFNLLVQ